MYQRVIGGFTVALLALIAALLAAVYTELRQVRDNTAGGTPCSGASPCRVELTAYSHNEIGSAVARSLGK